MIEALYKNTREKMEETLHFLARDLASISTGRASPDLLNTVKVESYGSLMSISQLASISVPDSKTLSIQVWDRGSVKAIEKAIVDSNLGFNPMTDGQLIRISIPKLSEERRIDLGKLARKYGEDKKIATRNIRRDILDEIKKLEKQSSISKDQIHDSSDKIQQITDEFIKKIDEMVQAKEKDLISI